MDEKIKIYDTVRANESVLCYGHYNHTTNSSKLKKMQHWSNIFTWKKKSKQSPQSIINYSFVASNDSPHKYGSVSNATAVEYRLAPNPSSASVRLAAHRYVRPSVPPQPHLQSHSQPPLPALPMPSLPVLSSSVPHVHASIRTVTASARKHHNSLFYSPWESVHHQSVKKFCDHFTCPLNACNHYYGSVSKRQQGVVNTANSKKDIAKSRRYSRMELYSLDEEASAQNEREFKSKSSDSIYKPNKELTPNGLKSCKSSLALHSNGGSTSYSSDPLIANANRGHSAVKSNTSSTVNERFLKFFKKATTDPFNSIASRKSILECEVSAYDLIKTNIKMPIFEDDIDDNLSDNAIIEENENNVANVRNSLNHNRKSINSKSTLIESSGNHFNSDSGSDSETVINTSHSSSMKNSVRIAGQGMHVYVPSKHNQTKSNVIDNSTNSSNSSNSSNSANNNKASSHDIASIKTYSSVTQITNKWTNSTSSANASQVILAEQRIMALPEPDYDTDDNDINDMDLMSTKDDIELPTFPRLKVSYSPPPLIKRVHNGLKQPNSCVSERAIAKNNKLSSVDHYSKQNNLNSDNKNNAKSDTRLCSRSVDTPDQQKHSPYQNTNNTIDFKELPYISLTAPGLTTDSSRSQLCSSAECAPLSPPTPPSLPSLPLPPPPPLQSPHSVSNNKCDTKSSQNSSSITTSLHSELRDKLNFGVKSILKKRRISSDQLSKCEIDSNSNQNQVNSSNSNTCDYLKTFKEFKEFRLKGGRNHRKHVHFKSYCDDTLIIDHINETIPEVDENEEPIYDDVALPSSIASDIVINNCKTITCCQTNDKFYDYCQATERDLNSSPLLPNKLTMNSFQTDDREEVFDKDKEIAEFREFDPSEEESSLSTWMKRVDHCKAKQQTTNTNAMASKCSSNSDADGKQLCEAVRGPKGPPKNTFPLPAAKEHNNNNNSNVDSMRTPSAKPPHIPVDTHSENDETSISPKNITVWDQIYERYERGKHYIQALSDSKLLIRATPELTSETETYSSNTDKSDTTIDYKQKQLTLPVSQEINTANNNKKSTSERNISQIISNTEIENCCNFCDLNDPTVATMNSKASLAFNDCTATTNQTETEQESQITDTVSPFRCTISILNTVHNNNQNNHNINSINKCTQNYSVDTNLNTISETSGDLVSFESSNGSSISSSSFYDSSVPQSPNSTYNANAMMRMRSSIDNESINDSPIRIVCSNTNDKIIINVPLDNNFDNINDHIYEELDTEPIYVDAGDNLENVKSIFDGASKDEILEFLEDAKERVLEDILVDAVSDSEIIEAIDVIEDIHDNQIIHTKNLIETSLSSNRRNRTSNVSNSSTDSTATTSSSIDIDDDILKCGSLTTSSSVGQLVERNDSGVGAETSKPSRLRKLSLNDEVEHQCADCEMHVNPNEDEETGFLHYPLFCHRCDKKRSERKEIISEIVDTEFKYGRDLRIIREEFYRPIEIAGLLIKDQLRGVFLNLDELIAVNSKFSEKLQDAIDIATEQGDEDFTTVNIGKLFRESSAMVNAFEAYCVRQGSAALLLNHLEKEKELLRIFLRVSQMENTLLRRMNLRSFLVVPVQRVTKYPLLLNRLYKVTPYHHRDREALREAQQKVELHLEHINQQTKGTIGTTTRIWRRISNLSTSHRRLNNVDDIGNIKIRKAALEILKWNQDETQFVTIGKLFFTSITDYTINKKAKTLKFLTASALLVTVGRPTENYRPDLVNTGQIDRDLIFPRDNTGINDAVLLLIKEKCGRYALCKEPFHLGSCVISCEADSDDIFEIHEYTTRESYLFKAESLSETKDWLKQLRYHSKDLGNWRRRRNALANIMMTHNVRQ